MAILAQVAKVHYSPCSSHNARVAEAGSLISLRKSWDSDLLASYAENYDSAVQALRMEVWEYLRNRDMPLDSFTFEVKFTEISLSGYFWPHFDTTRGNRHAVLA